MRAPGYIIMGYLALFMKGFVNLAVGSIRCSSSVKSGGILRLDRATREACVNLGLGCPHLLRARTLKRVFLTEGPRKPNSCFCEALI